MNNISAVDLFCGAGGESTGLHQAAETLGLNLELLAINHWDIAIDTHSINHKYAKHMCESIKYVDPIKAIPSGKLDLLWASPECTHFSNARGGKPKDEQSRASVKMIMNWLKVLDVNKVIIENVQEFRTWGPLDEEKNPIKERKGEFFNKFLKDLGKLGYQTDHRILCAADYGDPTTRRRLFIQAVKSDKEIKWPIYSHTPSTDLFTKLNWKAARDIIDWSIPGKSIFNRKKPLADNTIARIEAGIIKYWGEWTEPFLVILRGTGQNHINNSALRIDKPLPTITASGTHIGIVEPFILHKMSKSRAFSILEPIPAITTKSGHALIEPFMMQMNGSKANQIKSSVMSLNRPVPTITAGGLGKIVLIEPFFMDMTRTKENHKNRVYPCSEPIRTITTKNNISLITPFIIPYYGSSKHSSIEKPLDTITTKDRFALIQGNLYSLDIRFRMLQPHELAAAHSFPKDYIFTGNKTEKVKQVGNSVPVKLAKALSCAILS